MLLKATPQTKVRRLTLVLDQRFINPLPTSLEPAVLQREAPNELSSIEIQMRRGLEFYINVDTLDNHRPQWSSVRFGMSERNEFDFTNTKFENSECKRKLQRSWDLSDYHLSNVFKKVGVLQ